MIRTENMIYPALFHFINNSLPSVLSGFLSGGIDTDQMAATEQLMEQGLPLSFLGIYIAMACIVPFGFYTADYLLKKNQREEKIYLSSNKTLVLLIVLTILPIIIGMVLFLYGFFFEAGIFTRLR